MFDICVGFTGSFFHFLYLFFIIILKSSCYVGWTIANTLFYICDIIGDILSAIYIIGEEFYRFICDIQNDTAEVIDYVHHSTNHGINWFIEIVLIFIKHAKSFLCNTKLHSKLLATKTGSFFQQSFLTIRNSLVLIVECIWECLIFIPKLVINFFIYIGDCTIIALTVIRIVLVTLITDVLFLSALTFSVTFIFGLWIKRSALQFYFKRIFVKCWYKMCSLIHNLFNRSPSSTAASLSSLTGIRTTWSLLNSPTPSMNPCDDSQIEPQCVICQDRLKCMVLLPCKHLCLCELCLHTMIWENQLKCPLCRRDLEGYLSVYI